MPQKALHHEPRIPIELPEIPALLGTEPVLLVHQRAPHDQHVKRERVPRGVRRRVGGEHLVRVEPDASRRGQDPLAALVGAGEHRLPRVHLERHPLLV